MIQSLKKEQKTQMQRCSSEQYWTKHNSWSELARSVDCIADHGIKSYRMNQ